MVYYVKKELVTRFTFIFVFMFFSVQSYVSWVALKREQYRALSIYINSQQETWTDLRTILDVDYNATTSNVTATTEYIGTIQTGNNESRRNPGSAIDLENTVTQTEAFQNRTLFTDDRNNDTQVLAELRDMIKRTNLEDRNTLAYKVKQQVNNIVNMIKDEEDIDDSPAMSASYKHSRELVFKLKDLERNEIYGKNEISPTNKLNTSNVYLMVKPLDIPIEQISVTKNMDGTQISNEKQQDALVKKQDGRTLLSKNKPDGDQNSDHELTKSQTDSSWNSDNTYREGELLKADEDLCPAVPPNLVGPLTISEEIPPVDEDILEIEAGGRWRPKDCTAREKVAVIIPYRDREEHLFKLLNHLHPILHRQNLDYTIYVVELALPTTFNRGVLLNIGFKEASSEEEYHCYIFHDVDLLPEDDRNLYTCPDVDRPRHMSVAVSSFNYKLPYKTIFGGVSALTGEQFVTVNGFSNLYFGWGGEDDDLSYRLRYKGYEISRYSSQIARYTMLKHNSESKNPDRMKLLNWSVRRPCTEGLDTLNYRLIRVKRRPLYTWLHVQVDETEVKRSGNKKS